MKFKIGDRVRCKWNDQGTKEHVGKEGRITEVDASGYKYLYSVDWTSANFSEDELELLKVNKKNMDIIEKFKISMMGETEKSFRKLGIIDSEGDLTDKGEQLFTMWVFEKSKAEFKKDVVDVLIAADKEEKNAAKD